MVASPEFGVKTGNYVKIACFDTCSGISGDMTVGALLDAGRDSGLSIEALSDALGALSVGGYRLTLEPVRVGALSCSRFDVSVDQAPHLHRDWRSIRRMIEDAGRAGLGEGVVDRAVRTFEVLAEAEAAVHGVEPDEVHFHEVGAVDSIVDIVATAWCLDELGIEKCFVGPIPSGSGFVQTEHGRLPVPAPATALLLEGFEVLAGDGEGELVTPTGAAILNALAKPLKPRMHVARVGIGAGTKRWSDRPNILRVFIGDCDIADETGDPSDTEIIAIEADIDDMSPAALAHACERIRSVGARDVSVQPLQMKKSRLASRLTVLCDLERLDEVAASVLGETTSIGLRYRTLQRQVLPRRIESVATPLGNVDVKVVVRPDGEETAEPEFEDVAKIARDKGLPFHEVRAAAMRAWRDR
jgi:uncharacterized protein (TIGR00299 family) protein